jgi:hypothetical protein
MLEPLIRVLPLEIMARVTRTGIDRCHVVTTSCHGGKKLATSENLRGQKVARWTELLGPIDPILGIRKTIPGGLGLTISGIVFAWVYGVVV